MTERYRRRSYVHKATIPPKDHRSFQLFLYIGLSLLDMEVSEFEA